MIDTLTLLTGATISTTGGTAQTFGPTGTQIAGGKEVADFSASGYITRPKAVFRSKMPVLAADGSYSKMKLSATYTLPMVDSQGQTQFNLVRVEIEKHPEITAANFDELKNKGSQLLTDSDLTNFWLAGALS